MAAPLACGVRPGALVEFLFSSAAYLSDLLRRTIQKVVDGGMRQLDVPMVSMISTPTALAFQIAAGGTINPPERRNN